MWSSDASLTTLTWPEEWEGSLMTDRLENLHDDSNYNLTSEGAVSHEVPEWLVKLDLSTTLLMTFNTITLMLGMGSATYWKEFWDHLRRPWACLIGMACQFVLLPAVSFGLCLTFHLPPYEALGVLILACSPGGAFSNFFTFWVDGDLALSIMMTALSSMLAFGMMPLNVWLYSWHWTNQELQVPYVNILISLVIVTGPVIVGMVVRHFSSKWASYLSKVCSVSGWAGALACGVMLILRYWNIIVKSSIYLVIIAALTPLSGFLVAYVIVKILCFSHKICRTVAIETGCQNMVVATSIILLSFTESQARGQMVLFPVLYGLCQLAEVMVATGLFQAWLFVHRHDVTEEEITSVLDTSVLTSVPVPAHKMTQVGMKQMADYSTVPDLCYCMELPHQYHKTSGYRQYPNNKERHESEEINSFLPRQLSSQMPEILGVDLTPTNPPTPNDPDSTIDYQHEDSIDLDSCSDGVLECVHIYDSDGPCSPSLSNRGVPNMFPVTESDFQNSFSSDKEGTPLSYGSPLLSHKERPLGHVDAECSPVSASSTSLSSPEPYTRPFAFYHRDIRLGQTQQFSTFGRK